jgi:hypothetical protein
MANTRILYLEANKRSFTKTFLEKNPAHFYRNEDGKIDAVKRMVPNPPWIYVKPGAAMNCMYWHHILFMHVFNEKKVPIQCQNCWKVVAFPRDIEELFAIYLLQKEMSRACKCGTETERDNTPRHYGGYWYNSSMAEGMECFNAVREALDRDKVYESAILGCPIKVRFNDGYDEPIKLILKRGCTEFEQNCGPSDQWGWDDDQVELERIAFDSFSQEILHSSQTDIQLSTIFLDWIHRAFRIGDEKYLKFTNGNPLFEPPVTYHDMPKKKLKEFMDRTVVCPR